MAYAILESAVRPVLVLTPTTSVYSGSIRIGPTGAFIIQVRGAAAEEFVYWVPDAPGIQPGASEPMVWAETYLVSAVITGDSAFPIGTQQVTAGYAPDPRGGPSRWLMLRGGAHAMGGLVVGYRITVQRAESPLPQPPVPIQPAAPPGAPPQDLR